MTQLLRPVGFFPEHRNVIVYGPSLLDLVSREPHPEESHIVSYLSNGVTYSCVMANAHDALHPEVPIGPMHVLTDGIWAWPQYLAYYVQRYHISLPAEFLEHARRREWRPPQRHELALEQLALPRGEKESRSMDGGHPPPR